MDLLTTSLGRLRVIAFVEGISYLLLLFVAMPLKYLAGKPEMVTAVGSAHGALFVAYVAAVLYVWVDRRWPFKRVMMAMIASVVPFATFWLEGELRKEQAASAVAA